MVSWICSDVFSIDPVYFTASAARKAAGISIKRGEDSKKKVLEFVIDNEPSFMLEYTSKGNIKPGVTDRSDSWVIAKAGLLFCQNKNKS